MIKTSVYLTEQEADALRRAAGLTGLSQSELIREGIRRVVAEHGANPRTFHSMARGRADVGGQRGWTSEELYEKTRGRRPRGSHR